MDRADIEAEMDDWMEGDYWPAEVLNPTGGTDDGGVPEIEIVPETVPDQSAANGIFRRLKRLGHEAAQVNAVVDADIARLNAFRSDRLSGIDKQVTWAARALEPFARQVIPGSGKKSLKLPDGTLKLRDPGKGKVVPTDPPAFLEWAGGLEREDFWVGDVPAEDATDDERRQYAEAVRVALAGRLAGVLAHPELLRITVEPAAAELAKLDKGGFEKEPDGAAQRAPLSLPDGEMVPGIVIEKAATDKFDYELGED